MENIDTLIRWDRGHTRAYPLAPIRVRTDLGDGRLVSLTDDGWAEVELDGETRRDEYPAERVELLLSLSAAA